MWHILWEFRVAPERRAEFERVYSAAGEWAALFAKSQEFRGTTLLRDPQVAGRYVTEDVWKSAEAFERLKEEFAAEYKRLDELCEALTEYEMKIGGFQEVGGEER
ncbi:hypothetical protein Acid345_1563 [Candidatus Koribacter versatilis Ellin345]|uniref:ABM domain-containing protein n=1 Tax=Koribacter versatilis (strain Ellin345) TaxID=204669 RepID=Q1IRD5_KORVE|nr:antibiotic biosynthesis monooxygenase [Candidatus Koribacter versatilis]ABF40565.1 hypothetical protein Acid345_1563 [Candidatus Koribacter versatilis Ellin345]